MIDLRSRLCLLLLTIIATATTPACVAGTLVVYSKIPGRAPSEHYRCRVKLEGQSRFQEAFEPRVPIPTRSVLMVFQGAKMLPWVKFYGGEGGIRTHVPRY